MKRGALIVFEGCDRTGKSTQSRMLFNELLLKYHNVKHMAFPARNSSIGQLIDSYLTNKQDLSDETIHMLFSANRWEFKNEMNKLLQSGTTLIVDRYSYSGVAYSAAKGLNYDWCMAMEKGLICPDAVFYLDSTIDKLQQRGNFGKERYEKKEFQKKVSIIYEQMLKENSFWYKIDADRSKESIFDDIYYEAVKIITNAADKPLKLLK